MRTPKIFSMSQRLLVTDWKYCRIWEWAASTFRWASSTFESILNATKNTADGQWHNVDKNLFKIEKLGFLTFGPFLPALWRGEQADWIYRRVRLLYSQCSSWYPLGSGYRYPTAGHNRQPYRNNRDRDATIVQTDDYVLMYWRTDVLTVGCIGIEWQVCWEGRRTGREEEKERNDGRERERERGSTRGREDGKERGR